MKIILASGSPRRKELMSKMLEKYNKDYIVEPSSFDEEGLKAEISNPKELVLKLAYGKAFDIFSLHKDDDNYMVIGSDLLIHFNNEILGKPKNTDDAFDMLKRIQNNCHEVYTGMIVMIKENENVRVLEDITISKVYMKPMSDSEIIEYIETGEPMDKGGSYAIQGIGSKFIEKYDGSFDAIVGLNISKLEEQIKELIN